jgi:hypothetical protein
MLVEALPLRQPGNHTSAMSYRSAGVSGTAGVPPALSSQGAGGTPRSQDPPALEKEAGGRPRSGFAQAHGAITLKRRHGDNL